MLCDQADFNASDFVETNYSHQELSALKVTRTYYLHEVVRIYHFHQEDSVLLHFAHQETCYVIRQVLMYLTVSKQIALIRNFLCMKVTRTYYHHEVVRIDHCHQEDSVMLHSFFQMGKSS